jgi:hypothetical protein
MNDNGLSKVLRRVRQQEDTTFGDAAALATELVMVATLAAKVRDSADDTVKQIRAEAALFRWLEGYEQSRLAAGLPPLDSSGR